MFNKTDKAGLDSPAKGRWKLEHGLGKVGGVSVLESVSLECPSILRERTAHDLFGQAKWTWGKDVLFYTFYKRKLEMEE